MTASQRVVVTGVNGFVGQHVVSELCRDGFEVVGVGRETEPDVGDGLVDYVCADLARAWRLPDSAGVVHLAGLSAVGPSFDDPQRYLDGNGAMMVNLGEALVASGAPTRVIVVSSGAVYDAHASLPVTEQTPIAETSPYVVSKLLVEHLAEYYRRRGVDAIVVRPFNHIGPGQGPGFLVPDLAAAVVAARGGEVEVGDLTTRRDYTDVRDVARAYRMLVTAAELSNQHVFNVCSGVSRSGEEVLEAIRSALGSGDVEVRVDPARIRPQDPRDIRGSADRLERAVGWRPSIPFQESIRDFVASSGLAS